MCRCSMHFTAATARNMAAPGDECPCFYLGDVCISMACSSYKRLAKLYFHCDNLSFSLQQGT